MGLETEAGQRVARRTVFYIEGYDQRGPSHYHALYRDEAAKQQTVNGLAMRVGPCRTLDDISSAWTISAPRTETEYVFLRYDDLMRARRPRTNLAVLADFSKLGWAFITRGVYANMIRHSWPVALFFSFAPLLIVIALLIAGLVALVTGFLTSALIGLSCFLLLSPDSSCCGLGWSRGSMRSGLAGPPSSPPRWERERAAHGRAARSIRGRSPSHYGRCESTKCW